MATTESSDVNVNVDAPYSEMADKGKMVKKSKKIGVEERDYKVFCCGNSSYDLMVRLNRILWKIVIIIYEYV